MDWIMIAVQIGVYLLTVGAIYGTVTTRLKYIEEKLDKHNNFITRVYALEKTQGEQDLRIKYLEKEKEN